jgi:hypothetical protein
MGEELTWRSTSFALLQMFTFGRHVSLPSSVLPWLLSWIESIFQYTAQKIVMVHETPDLYQGIVQPYIESFPKSRTQWLVLPNPFTVWDWIFRWYERIRVDNILSGLSEQSKILCTCPEFLIIPDMKWDLITISSLYLLAIARGQSQEEQGPRRIRSMRDLRKGDLPWLKKILIEAGKIVKTKWSLGEGGIRCFIHYQPSYCELFIFHLLLSWPCWSSLNCSCRPLPRAHCERKLHRLGCGYNGWPSVVVGWCY